MDIHDQKKSFGTIRKYKDNMKTSPHFLGQDDPLCAQCSRLSGGCCITSVDDTAYCFPLAEGEIERLMPYANLAEPLGLAAEHNVSTHEKARQAVCAPEKNSAEFIKSMAYLFPRETKKITELFPESDLHYRLRLKENGACTFLGEEGCRLPREARPWYCLLFPAWFQSGELTVFISDVCLATKDVTEPLLVLEKLDIPKQSAQKIFDKLTADWGFSQD